MFTEKQVVLSAINFFRRNMKLDFKKLYARYMSFIGVIGQMVFYSQAYKIYTTQSASDVSLLGFVIGFIAVTSWLIYGVILNNFPLIISNAVACIGAVAVVVGIIIYG